MYATITSKGSLGYRCTAKSPGMNTSVIRKLEQLALPFGDSWDSYIGARSIKTFPIGKGEMAISYVQVSDDQDDYGRPGILFCQCVLVSFDDFMSLVYQPSFAFEHVFRNPASLKMILGELAPHPCKLTWWSSSQIPQDMLRMLAEGLLRIYSNRKLILSYQYQSPTQWKYVEQTIQTLMVLLPPMLLRRLSFATLSLSIMDPSSVIAVPRYIC
jgi:hypothetical protein